MTKYYKSLGFPRIVINKPPFWEPIEVKLGLKDSTVVEGKKVVISDISLFLVDKAVKITNEEIMATEDTILYSENIERGDHRFDPIGKYFYLNLYEKPISSANLTETFKKWKKNGYEPQWIN